jgi:hypothetical protein
MINEPTYSNRELLLERDELVSKLAAERKRNSDLWLIVGVVAAMMDIDLVTYQDYERTAFQAEVNETIKKIKLAQEAKD